MIKELWYATATNKKGEQKIITNITDTTGSRLKAENAAKAHCKQEGLNFEQILPTQNAAYQGTPQHKSLFKRIATERAKK